MEFLSVVVAAAAAFALGAGYYSALAKPWTEAAGVECNKDGKPKGGQSPAIFALAFVLQLIVVGMMRHVFTLSGVETLGAGLVGGAGIGLFFISPWIALNNMYGMRPMKLTLIDGGYATLACAVSGLVLSLF
ncbi:DUF1761 domain-containing protein [Leisingera methylohalidivorans]|uniref:DUF1761 domain-containing protein n=1 Tax=Leisingera methylohalidivorans DSM 14336 TaxID=999552 RepID=V9VXJ7_9RHOB|nr:DUF1761 domain-containing protein [Leisingera methylohalidivorans]AHD02663.1 hypothetical protein METH_20290 [Leisingera methylohalidivorans DSM 14336]